MLHVTLRQLEYIVAVARAGSVSAAAAQLNVSQPALSVAIGQVERRVGERLFLRRKGAATVLTGSGRLFVQDAELLLADAARLDRPLHLSQRPPQRITLGILEELAPRWMAPFLVCLRTAFPGTVARIVPVSFDRQAEDLLSGAIDLGLTYELGLDATFRRDLFARVSPAIWVAPDDPIAGQASAGLAEIAGRALILSDQDLSIQHMLGMFRGIGVTPKVRHRVPSVEVMRSLAANGEGTGISYTDPPGTLTYDGKSVARVRVRDPAAEESVVLAYLDGLPAPVADIRRALIASLAGVPGAERSGGAGAGGIVGGRNA
ncbi:MAG: LysR family transcriptional regulator [Paracoccaceae bacterium]|nr:MAG: LysR family transcriptional regulator [Paracoccaceae bacterium]